MKRDDSHSQKKVHCFDVNRVSRIGNSALFPCTIVINCWNQFDTNKTCLKNKDSLTEKVFQIFNDANTLSHSSLRIDLGLRHNIKSPSSFIFFRLIAVSSCWGVPDTDVAIWTARVCVCVCAVINSYQLLQTVNSVSDFRTSRTSSFPFLSKKHGKKKKDNKKVRVTETEINHVK